MVKTPGELERAIELAYPSGRNAAVLVMLDADADCPATLGPSLLTRAERAARERFPVGVVLANVEYEAWLIAGAESLRRHRGLPADLEAPATPEEIVGAKQWLGRNMAKGNTYSETLEQPALTSVLDIGLARSRAPSLDKFCREVDRLITEARSR
jgi:hypothetical protein